MPSWSRRRDDLYPGTCPTFFDGRHTRKSALSPCCSGDIEHCLIARMALHVARCYYGVIIYMTYAIIPWGRAYGQCSVDEVREFL
jgi:hypothetical protein